MEFSEKQIIYRPLEGMTAIYVLRDGVMSFTCVPTGTEGDVIEKKLLKEYNEEHPYFEIEPMVQVARKGDSPRRDFSSGATMYDTETSFAFRVYDQTVTEDEKKREIVTFLRTADGLEAKHILTQQKGFGAAELHVEIVNNGKDTVLDNVASFAINAITPFELENDPDTLVLHRLHSNWSGEGRKESSPVSRYNFEDSWSSLGVRIQKVGALGSMPARGYIPFMALEDEKHGVTWAVQTEAPDSWQIEAIHRYGSINLVGGHADYLYGHWRKNLKSGEKFETRKAYFTVVKGDLTKVCAALTRYHDTLYHIPETEQSLPVLYNEYLHSWGNPTMENVRPQLKVAKEAGAEYFVLDAGWFGEFNSDNLGDWIPVKEKFPNGLIEFAEEIKKEGFTAGGVWFEFESVTDKSETYKKHSEWLLTADGVKIDHMGRMFLDFRKSEVTDFLVERVMHTLKENKLNYTKIDYNENVGFAVDGAESVGEGLRQHIEKVVEFFKRLRAEVPGLVMEVCSSGGMRHDPLFSTMGSMVSFSDAHENADGAVVAIELHRIMQPRTMQIWASILPKHDIEEVKFTMVKSMLGRICLSGRLEDVSKETFDVVKAGVRYYDNLKEIILDGETVLIDTDEITSLRHPKGVARLVRESADKKKLAYYAFGYNCDAREAAIPAKGYKLLSYYGNAEVAADGEQAKIILGGKPLSAAVMILEKE